MKNKALTCILAVAGALLVSASNGFSFGSFGTNVNTACAPAAPYTQNDCALCHVADRAASTPAKTAYLAGGTTLTDYFCPSAPPPPPPPPPPPGCTDNDGDSYALEGGTCGPVDCNDTNAAVSPGATENCTDGIDNNCNGLIDALDPAAVGCQTCTDNDNDGYWVGGPTCTPVDCNDTNAAVRPGATENCTDGIDNNCNGLIDALDPAAVGCQTCTDNDKDGFWVGGPTCSPVDCDDTNVAIRPSATENCNDGIDNNCNGLIDALDPTAVGCQTLAPDIDISPTTLNFNTVMIGKESQQTLTVQNLGTAALTINTINSCPGTSAEFSWLPAGPFTLPAKTSMTLSVISAPLDAGTDTGCLSVSSNDPDESTVEIALQAAGVQYNSILPFLPLLLNPANRQNP